MARIVVMQIPGASGVFEMVRGGFVVLALVGLLGCGQEAPKTEAPKPSATQSAPAAPGKAATEQAVVDSIKAPMDKARGVESTLEKAAGKAADQVKEAAP